MVAGQSTNETPAVPWGRTALSTPSGSLAAQIDHRRARTCILCVLQNLLGDSWLRRRLIPLGADPPAQPETPGKGRLRPKLAIQRPPWRLLRGRSQPGRAQSFRIVGPIYGKEVGLTAGQSRGFCRPSVLGARWRKFPVCWLADKFRPPLGADLAFRGRRWLVAHGNCYVGLHGHAGGFLAASFLASTDLSDYSVPRRSHGP